MNNKNTTQFIKWFRLPVIFTITLVLATCSADDPPAAVPVKDISYNVYDEKGHVIERKEGIATTLVNNIGASSGVSYTLAASGTVTNINNVKLPTIDPNNGTVTITTETKAGSYRVTATGDGVNAVGTAEAMVYVTVKPTTTDALGTAIETGIGRYNINADFNYIITSEIINMECLFSKDFEVFCNNYAVNTRPYLSNFNGDVSRWDVSKVTNMLGTFHNTKFFNQNIGNWDVSKVVDMQAMFQEATVFNQSIGNWDVSKVTRTAYMFNNAIAFNQDISTWTVDEVTNMESMFYGATDFDQSLEKWNVASTVKKVSMFVLSGVSATAGNLPCWYDGNGNQKKCTTSPAL